ncbi:MAG: FkbM family methyltransferase [Candidatus Omnitrophota bacterium]
MRAGLNQCKQTIWQSYLFYKKHFPVNRGKYAVGALTHSLIGYAEYDIGGLSLMLSGASIAGELLIRGKPYQPEVVSSITEALAGGGNFIDIGANIGYMSLNAALFMRNRKNPGMVYAFEPSAREYGCLLNNIRINGFENIKAFNKGIGPAKTTAPFYVANIGHPGANSKYRLNPRDYRCATAEFAPLAAEMTDKEIAAARCVKIDVEGDEVEVLSGIDGVMRLLRDAVFIVEINDTMLGKAGRRAEEIYDFFYRHSFVPKKRGHGALPVTGNEIFVKAR